MKRFKEYVVEGKKNYVSLTFRPKGSKKDRTVWAIPRGKRKIRGTDVLIYSRVTSEGSKPDTEELILISPDSNYKEERAKMNLHYGKLERA